MTRCLNTLFICIAFFPFMTSAGTIEVAQWIPWEFISKEIYKQPISIAIQESEWQMNFSELTPKLQGVKIDIQGELNNLSFNSSGIHSSQTFNAGIQVDKILIDQFIIRDFNGNQIRIHLKAICEAISISIPQLLTIAQSEFIQDGNLWRPELTKIGISIPHNSWNVSPIICSGIGGVGDEMSEALTRALKDPSVFEPMIKSMLSNELKNVFKKGWESLQVSTGEDLAVKGMDRPGENGFLVFAEIKIKNNRQVYLQKPDESFFSKKNPQFILSATGFEALLEDKFMDLAPQKYNLQEVPAFAGLMKSRTKQFFAWPDLRRFPTTTPFLLSTFNHQSQLRLLQRPNGKWQANLKANGVLETSIGSSPIDYIHFGLGVVTELSVKVTEGKLQLASGSSQLELAWNYGYLYQMIYRPNSRIALEIFKSSLNQFFTNRSVEKILPVLNFQKQELKLQNLKQQNEIITMDWL